VIKAYNRTNTKKSKACKLVDRLYCGLNGIDREYQTICVNHP